MQARLLQPYADTVALLPFSPSDKEQVIRNANDIKLTCIRFILSQLTTIVLEKTEGAALGEVRWVCCQAGGAVAART